MQMDTSRKTASLLLYLTCFTCGTLLLVACDSNRRKPIEGTVTLDGRPMPNGQIRFIPKEGTNGPTAGAKIDEGKYSISAELGIFAGTYRVEITASRPGGRKMPDRVTGQPVDVYKQFIPSKYNTKSELVANVTADGPNVFDFAVTAK